MLFGNSLNYWIYSNENGFDLTRHSKTNEIKENNFICFQSDPGPIWIDPLKSAIIIIDMQNFFLHPSIRSHPNGLNASENLSNEIIPWARQSNIQLIWLNWGLDEEDIDEMPPGLLKIFSSDLIDPDDDLLKTKKDSSRINQKQIYTGFGHPMGNVHLSDGHFIDAGRLLMKNTWNAQIYQPLFEIYQSNQHIDQYFHKNRPSGLWNNNCLLMKYLREHQLTTLFFAGVNTDQCVFNTVQDAFNQGFDCILLIDACGTTSSQSIQQSIQYQICHGGKFLLKTNEFLNGIYSSLFKDQSIK